jgi:hypothetical protein
MQSTTANPASVFLQEGQFFARWVYAVLVLAGIVAAAGLFLAAQRSGQPLSFPPYAPAIAIVLFLVFNLLYMETTVLPGAVRVRFGWFFPMFGKTVALDDVTEVRAVEYRPLVQSGGWGYRFGRFGGRACTFLTARGTEGVLLTAPGRTYLVGSQAAGELEGAIRQAAGL